MRWPTGSDVVALRSREGNRSRFYLGVQRGKERTSGCLASGTAGTFYLGCHYEINGLAGDAYDADEHYFSFGTVGMTIDGSIRPGMTLAVGTLDDPFAGGAVRIRYVDVAADRIYVEPNNLAAEGWFIASDYIYVDGVYRLYRILPYIVAGVVYEDGNPDTAAPGWGLEEGIAFGVDYLDRPVALMGSPRVAWAGETIDFYGWRSHGRGGNVIQNWTWDFDGGVCVGPGVGFPGSPYSPLHVRWPTPGEYIASLTVEDDSGKAGNDFYGVPFIWHTAVRPVLVFDRPGQGDHPPYTNFEVTTLRGKYGGGWKMTITVFDTADKDQFPDNALVILFSEDWHGGVLGSRGGWYGQEHILFVGHIKGDSVRVDSEASSVTFEAQTVEQWMKEIDVWPANFENTAGAPTRWHEFQAMTCEDILWYLAEFRSTLKNVTDCFFASDVGAEKRVDFLDLTESDLYNQMSDQTGSCFFGELGASRHGSIHLAKHKNMMDLAERTVFGPPIYVFSRQDWRDRVEVGEERMRDSVAQVDFIGFIYDVNGNPQEVYSLSPERQNNFGRIEKVTGILLSGNTRGPGTPSEAEANTLSGLYRAWKNIRFPHVQIPAFNNRFLEPATQDYFGLVLGASDTFRGFEWAAKEFLTMEVAYEISNEDGILLVDVTGEASTWGPDGVAGEYPEAEPVCPDNPSEYFGIWPGAAGGDSPLGEGSVPPPWSDADEWVPGAWVLDHDPGRGGEIYEMVYFKGNVFAFCYGGSGGGVWRQASPNWIPTIPIGVASRGAIFDDRMWWGTNPAGGGSGRYVSRSDDGIDWVLDLDLGPGCSYSHWSTMGISAEYLYATGGLICDVGLHPVWRRDKRGNWVSTPPPVGEVNIGHDVAGDGDYVYHSAAVWDVRRYATAWEFEPTLQGSHCAWFTRHQGTLFATAHDNEVARIYRRELSGWIREFYSTTYNWGGAISVGGDGVLYMAVTNDDDDSAVYFRKNGKWVLHSTVTGQWFMGVTADADGNLFAGTHTCEFWRYVPS